MTDSSVPQQPEQAASVQKNPPTLADFQRWMEERSASEIVACFIPIGPYSGWQGVALADGRIVYIRKDGHHEWGGVIPGTPAWKDWKHVERGETF